MKTLGKWAVVDCESASTEPNAALYSIGATMLNDLEIVDRFYVNIDINSCQMAGLHFSESTNQWWAKQSQATKDALCVNPVPLQQALQMYAQWIGSHGEVRLMGNGPTADNQWLDSAFKACNMKNPVPFWGDICHRTLNWIGSSWFGIDKKSVPFNGIQHHAGDDAQHEAEYAVLILNKLQEAFIRKEVSVANTQENDVNRQDFILSNIAELIRKEGSGAQIEHVAGELNKAYDIASGETQLIGTIETVTPDPEPRGGLTPQQQFDQGVTEDLGKPTADTVTGQDGSTSSTESSAPAEHIDDWGLAWDETWNAGGFGKTKDGMFKRKPKTNEEQYAYWLRDRVTEAQTNGTWTGPENWASLARMSKYYKADPTVTQQTQQADPTVTQQTQQADPTVTQQTQQADPTVTQQHGMENTLQQTAETVQDATAQTAGASAAAASATVNDAMQAHMKLVQTFPFVNNAPDARAMCILERYGVQNILGLTDAQWGPYAAAVEQVVLYADQIKQDASGATLANLLDSLGLPPKQ